MYQVHNGLLYLWISNRWRNCHMNHCEMITYEHPTHMNSCEINYLWISNRRCNDDVMQHEPLWEKQILFIHTLWYANLKIIPSQKFTQTSDEKLIINKVESINFYTYSGGGKAVSWRIFTQQLSICATNISSTVFIAQKDFWCKARSLWAPRRSVKLPYIT